MKTKTKITTGIIASMLSCVMLFTVATVTPNTNELVGASTRTVEIVKSNLDTQSVFDDFENVNLTQEGAMTYFEGYKALDTSRLSEVDYISEAELEELENCIVKYNVSFNSETNIVTLAAKTDYADGSYDIDEISGEAFINENGEVDAVMDVDGESILLSEMRADGMIENCGWLSRLIKSVAVIVTAVYSSVIMATAAVITVSVMSAKEEKNAESNKNFNSTKTEPTGYILDQNSSSIAHWRYGIKEITDNGCGPVAVYNTMCKLKMREDFVDVIYEMEKDSGTLLMGAAGADPTQMAEYFKNHDVNYESYNSLSSMQTAMANMSVDQMAIACFWTDKQFTNAHYISIEKTSNGAFEVYNGGNYSAKTEPITILDENYMGGQFITGYICGNV